MRWWDFLLVAELGKITDAPREMDRRVRMIYSFRDTPRQFIMNSLHFAIYCVIKVFLFIQRLAHQSKRLRKPWQCFDQTPFIESAYQFIASTRETLSFVPAYVCHYWTRQKFTHFSRAGRQRRTQNPPRPPQAIWPFTSPKALCLLLPQCMKPIEM